MLAVREPRLRSLIITCVSLACAMGGCADGGDVEPSGGNGGGALGGGGDGADDGGSGPHGNGGNHGCFSTESTCDGACVDVMSHPEHCGECNHPCAGGPNQAGSCVDGACVGSCAAGFLDDQGACKNFFGAHESYPAECAACSVANPYSGGCSCPAQTTEIALSVQSDCPAMALRSATALRLCATSGVSPESDFGGAYEVDDFDGLCGAMPGSCRVGNPMAGNACACPSGFEPISMRSIIRLPCDNTEVGATVVLCGNKTAPLTTFGGAFQFDDFAPNCRVTNPWTNDCTCPAGAVDRAYRVMVDGAAGLYGSTMHLCTAL